jgi:hypothetical protein
MLIKENIWQEQKKKKNGNVEWSSYQKDVVAIEGGSLSLMMAMKEDALVVDCVIEWQ